MGIKMLSIFLTIFRWDVSSSGLLLVAEQQIKVNHVPSEWNWHIVKPRHLTNQGLWHCGKLCDLSCDFFLNEEKCWDLVFISMLILIFKSFLFFLGCLLRLWFLLGDCRLVINSYLINLNNIPPDIPDCSTTGCRNQHKQTALSAGGIPDTPVRSLAAHCCQHCLFPRLLPVGLHPPHRLRLAITP